MNTNDKKDLSYGCCSIVLHENDASFAYAYRRDSYYSADLYIEKTKLYNKEAIKEYKSVNGYFFHTVVLKDGWFIGSGGADIPSLNKVLEDLGGKIASNGKIIDNDMKTAEKTLKQLGVGHFIIKSPDGNVGLSIYNAGIIKTTIFKMKKGEYVSVPNSPSYYRKGTYTVQKSNLVDAAIYMASTDKWGVNRRNIIVYDTKNINNSTKINIWASYDNGKNVGITSKGWQDNILYKGVKTKANSIPTIPNKIYIGEATLVELKKDSTVSTPSMKTDSILDASTNIKAFVEKNGQLPNYVTIENKKFSMDQYLYISSNAIASQQTGSLKNTVPFYEINEIKKADKPIPITIKANIDKSTFYDMANRTATYISKNKKTPSLVGSKYGDVQFQSVIYAYSKILDYYKKNKAMPNYVSLDVAKNSKLANYMPIFQ